MENKRLIGAKDVRTRFGVTDMSLWRWIRDEELNFPQPIYIQRRRFWEADAIEAFIQKQASVGQAA
ncbi:helix-turn-helix transcriptional regulator [Pseudorhodobacter sp. W20_MBD10_FR17]|uniref:helix-turn-helix transcriptional regulator n=1 Tax=Pseudorhodobacter sp. W20_MBD10_FR17 TaxID=3240266 RepID=UPI003F987D64